MTLHEAIEEVLKESGASLSANEIADQINSKGLYHRKDGTIIKPVQIFARVSNYNYLFEIKPNRKIALLNKDIILFNDLVKKLSSVLVKRIHNLNLINVILPVLTYLAWSRKRIFLGNDSKKAKEVLISLYEEIRNDRINNTLFPDFESLFYFLRVEDFEEIFDIIKKSQINEGLSELVFGPFFNKLINEKNLLGSYRGPEAFVPDELANLIAKIIDVQQLPIITDPYAGTASLLSAFREQNRGKNLLYHLVEDNIQFLLLGTLNLKANGFKKFMYFLSSDINDFQRYSSICTVTKPPFGGRFKEPFIWNLPNGQKVKTSEIVSASIVKILEGLKTYGKAFITVPSGVLFRSDRFSIQLRRYLITEHILTGVITLPDGLFKPYSGVSTTMLIIDMRKRKSRNKFLFYDLTSNNHGSINENGTKISELLSLNETIESGENFNFVSYDDIKDSQFQLDRSLIYNKNNKNLATFDNSTIDKKGFKIVSQLLDFFKGNSIKTNNLNKFEGVPFVQVSDLSTNIGITELDLSKVKRFVSDVELIKGQPSFIPNNSILISNVGTHLKATLFKNKSNVLCSNNIIVLKPKESLLPEYLIAIFQTPEFLMQIESIRTFNRLTSFRLYDFLNLYVDVPPIFEQTEYLNKFLSNQFQEQRELNEKANSNDLYNIISRMKHELMQSVSSLGMDLKLVKEYLLKKERNSDHLSLKDHLITVLPGMEKGTIERSQLDSVLNRMIKCQNNASETLTKSEETLRIGTISFNSQEILFKKFLREEILPLYENANCVIKIFHDDVINGDRYQLKVLFKNLIDNAIKHGFDPNTIKTKNLINIRLNGFNISTGYHEILVENNGKELPEDVNFSQFETRGVSHGKNSGTGFGGYHIKKVIENHKGQLELFPDKFNDFKVGFLIRLPI